MSQKKRSFLHYGQQDIDKTDINAITKVRKLLFDYNLMVERFEKSWFHTQIQNMQLFVPMAQLHYYPI